MEGKFKRILTMNNTTLRWCLDIRWVEDREMWWDMVGWVGVRDILLYFKAYVWVFDLGYVNESGSHMDTRGSTTFPTITPPPPFHLGLDFRSPIQLISLTQLSQTWEMVSNLLISPTQSSFSESKCHLVFLHPFQKNKLLTHRRTKKKTNRLTMKHRRTIFLGQKQNKKKI